MQTPRKSADLRRWGFTTSQAETPTQAKALHDSAWTVGISGPSAANSDRAAHNFRVLDENSTPSWPTSVSQFGTSPLKAST